MSSLFEYCRKNAQMIADNAPSTPGTVFAVWELEGVIETGFKSLSSCGPLPFIGFGDSIKSKNDVLNKIDLMEKLEPVKKKVTWGGKRRDGTTQTARSVKIDNDLIKALEKQGNKNRFINEAIREKLNASDSE